MLQFLGKQGMGKQPSALFFRVQYTWRSCNTLSKLPDPVDSKSLSEENEKQRLISEIKKKLRSPLADENGNLPTGTDRPIAIEVDGPSHFYVNTTKYTAYTKLKHRLLTRMGYKVLHVPYFEWRKLRGSRERENYLKEKLKEEPTEWLDPEDEKHYTERLSRMHEQISETKPIKPPPPPSRPRNNRL
jgi:hypothetical protein